MKTQKTVQVLTIYRFKETARICFVVESSNGKDTYNTCFNRDAEHGSCTCPALRGCYHLDQLKARAAEYFQSRQPVQPEKANPVAEAEAFIARVQSEKMALHNSNEGHFEERSGRLIPMR